jgi:hypothetical protein
MGVKTIKIPEVYNMKYRKNVFKKLMCLVTVAMFMCQCMSVRKGALIETQKNIDESKIAGYEYHIDRIKAPTPRDFTAEYKFVKLPLLNVEETGIYKRVKKYNRLKTAGLLAAIAIAVGLKAASEAIIHDEGNGPFNIYTGVMFGGLVGAIVSLVIKVKPKEIEPVKEPKNYLIKKSGSTPLPFENQPVEIQWYSGGKLGKFKTFTDNDGMIKINLADDLKLDVKEYSSGKSFSLVISYIKAETGEKMTLSVPL